LYPYTTLVRSSHQEKLYIRMRIMNKRQLILADGKVFTGDAFGAEGKTAGNLIFFTGVTGYQEVLSDPNYFGNIAVMTYPTIGNYGINRDDFESSIPFLNGMIVKEVAQ